MKEKEMYLADLRSLKENISNKIMEAIQDLEAKNLKKIEKKIEKASQKIAMGLIKASLKNAELLTRKITHAIGPVNSNKKVQPSSSKRREKISSSVSSEELPGFESNTLKTILASKSKEPKRRGRPSGSSMVAKTIAMPHSKKQAVSSTTDTPKKRGRPFGTLGSKSGINAVIGSFSANGSKSKRGRPKSSLPILPNKVDSNTNPEMGRNSKSIKIKQKLPSGISVPQKQRGRPRLIQNKSPMVNQGGEAPTPKGKRGRPFKIKTEPEVSASISPISSPNLSPISSSSTKLGTGKSIRSSVAKKEIPIKHILSSNHSTTIPKKRGRKPKIMEDTSPAIEVINTPIKMDKPDTEKSTIE